MKYRVRLDMSFTDEAAARSLMNYAENLADKAAGINEGQVNEEKSFTDLEACRHDEGLPCEKLERVEIRKSLP